MAHIAAMDDVGYADPETGSASLQPANILIVDDLPEKVMAYMAILEDLGKNIMVANSGEEALKKVLKHEFAVILLDVNMPGIDGFQTAETIRSRKKSASTPIIFLTAFNDDIKIAQGYASGGADYLPTPVVPEILRAKVKVFIELFEMRQMAAYRAEEKAKRIAAEMADRRKDEFLATLAHELRNPLAPIRNVLHILQNNEISADQIQKSYQLMDRQLNHMVRLVDDLMDVSRITRGKIELRMENVSLSDVIESAVETANPLLGEKQHSLKISLPKEPITMRGDFVRLSQIFSNLLNNAAKYSDTGSEIELRAFLRSGKAIIEVSDNGIGIDKDLLPHVFDLFMQVDNSLARSQGGLGLGLTLVKNLSEMIGGTVYAKSDGKGKGSTFTVELPVIEQAIARSMATSSVPVPKARNSKKVLIVDDNEPSGTTIGWMLDLLGHETMVLMDSQKAIEAVSAFKPDIVMLDIGLPGMDGYQLCKTLKKDPSLKNALFIAQTGWSQKEHLQRSKEAGFDHHLVKPIDYNMLKDLLNAAA